MFSKEETWDLVSKLKEAPRKGTDNLFQKVATPIELSFRICKRVENIGAAE